MKYSMLALACVLFVSMGAFGAVIVSVQSATAAAGGSGAFDVSLTNTATSTILVGAFTFGISITNPAISFTDANTSTVLASYIFAGHSLFGPDLTGPTSGHSILVSDVFATPMSGAAVASGATVDLGHVLFTVASDSVGGALATSLLASPATSLSDPLGAHITIDTLSNGTITVAAVPEPSCLLPVLGGWVLWWLRASFRRRETSPRTLLKFFQDTLYREEVGNA